MNLKNLLLIALLFVASSLLADPLTWHFFGTAGSGSTYNGTSIEGASLDLQIFLNTSLVGHKSPGVDEKFFDGPFRSQVSISGVGTLPVYFFDAVANFAHGGCVNSVVTLQSLGSGEQFVLFDHCISSTPLRLTPIPKTPTSNSPSLDFAGPNDLEVIGDIDSFSATTGPQVTELPGDGRTPSAPAAVSGALSDGTAILEVFIRGRDDRIYVNGLSNGGPGPATDFTTWREVQGDGLTISEPAAVIHNGVLKLFIRGLDNGIYQNIFTGSASQPDSGWSGWVEVKGGGRTLSGPAAVVDHGTLKLFVRGLDDRIYENDLNGSSKGWSEVQGGGLTISTPAAVIYKGVLKLFVRGLTNGIHENDFNGTSFSDHWDEVFGGGLTLAGPSALVDQGILKLFITGLDDGIWENNFDGTSFTGWSEVSSGGALTPSAPAAVEAFHLYPTVFLMSEDERILEGFF
jgi:hypothetical protein